MPPLSKPHAAWKHGLNEEERESTWKFAAGPNKSIVQHTSARGRFARTANEEAAEAKNECELDDVDHIVLKKKQVRLSKASAKQATKMEDPENRAKQNANQLARTRAKMEIPDYRAKNNEKASAWHKAKAHTRDAQRDMAPMEDHHVLETPHTVQRWE